MSREKFKIRPRSQTVLLNVLSILFLFIWLMPFFLVVLNASKSYNEIMFDAIALPSDWSTLVENVKAVMGDSSIDMLGAFRDSAIITILSLAIIVIFTSMCAWILVRNKNRWSRILFFMFVAAMVIPFQSVMFPMVRLLNQLGGLLRIEMVGSYTGLIFAYLGFGTPLSVFILHGFIKGIPVALEEAATIDGCSMPGIFFKIVFPLMRPIIITVLILNGIWIWNDYLLPLLLLGSNGTVQTIPLAVRIFAGSYVKQWNLIMTSALLAMLPIVAFFILAQKYIISGIVEGSVK